MALNDMRLCESSKEVGVNEEKSKVKDCSLRFFNIPKLGRGRKKSKEDGGVKKLTDQELVQSCKPVAETVSGR